MGLEVGVVVGLDVGEVVGDGVGKLVGVVVGDVDGVAEVGAAVGVSVGELELGVVRAAAQLAIGYLEVSLCDIVHLFAIRLFLPEIKSSNLLPCLKPPPW